MLSCSFKPRQVVRGVLPALLVIGIPALASKWVEVGNAGVTTDKVMVDVDSIQMVDEFKTADVMTVYGAPRVNSHGITLDRHVQRTAFNCTDHTAIGIRTTGYLGDKQVGGSPETADWRSKLVPAGNNPMVIRVFTVVCGTAHARKAKSSSGSGIVVDEVGDVLTNNHVVDHCTSISVKTPNSKPLVATVAAVDPKNDLAIIKISYDVPLGEPAHFRAQAQPARLGESIAVIGYPLTGMLSSEPKATFGQINSVAGYNNDYTLLQISAPVQPGNSGGPVLDESGQVIGVVVSQASLAVVAIAGNVPQNVNFAIRGEVAQIFLAARGIKILAGNRRHALSTSAVAAAGVKSTVFVQCSAE
ncbi:MAG TPA: serine protease [Steroidobacteraceae bacterium]